MNDEERLFSNFALLEPSADESANAINKTREAMLAIERTNHLTNQPSGRRWTRYAVAALVLLVAGIAWMGLPRSDHLLAQVIDQMCRAKSIRVVREVIDSSSEWQVETVTSFARDLGFSEQYFVGGELTQTHIDDGTHHWSFRPQQKVVTQSESIDFIPCLDELLDPLNSHLNFNRHPIGDQVIDDIPQACYRSTTEHNRVSIWLDADGQARRGFVEELENEKWRPARRINIEYDVELAPTTFQPPTGRGIKIVEIKQLLDEIFSLENAVHREQKLGYELAVHEVKRINDVEYYLLTSFRPTKETLKKLNLKRGESPGDLMPSARYETGRRSAQEYEGAQRLAVAYGGGIRIQALLCNFRGINNERADRARPAFTLFANPKLWSDVKSISNVSLDIELPEEKTPLEYIVRSVYDKIALLEAVEMEQVNLVDEQDGREFLDRHSVPGGYTEVTRQDPRPSEINFDDFLEHIRTSEFRPNLTQRAKAIEKRKREGSSDPLTFIEELSDSDRQQPERWRTKLSEFIDYPELKVQVAALQMVEKAPSLMYLEDVLTVIRKSREPEVQTIASRIVEALKRPLDEIKPRNAWPPVEINNQQINGLMESLKTGTDTKTTVAALRKLSGLDYGDGESSDSRKRWTRWASDEKASIRAAHKGEREFIIFGRVLDAKGQAASGSSVGVELTRTLGEGGVLQQAHSRADINGRYVLRFGFLKPNSSEHFPVVDARIRTHPKPIQNGVTADRLFVSKYNLTNDPILTQQNKSVAYSKHPLELNFTQQDEFTIPAQNE